MRAAFSRTPPGRGGLCICSTNFTGWAHWRALRTAMLISALYWLTQTLAIWALTRADRFDLGVSAAAFLLVVKAVVTLIPNAPASMGAYQAAAMYGLGLLLVEHANAQIFAEIMFWFLSLPVAIGGALAVAFTGVDITALHRRAAAHKAEVRRKES